jgi:hypothetical protein
MFLRSIIFQVGSRLDSVLMISLYDFISDQQYRLVSIDRSYDSHYFNGQHVLSLTTADRAYLLTATSQ